MTTSDFTTAAPIGSGRRKSQPLSSSKEEKEKIIKERNSFFKIAVYVFRFCFELLKRFSV